MAIEISEQELAIKNKAVALLDRMISDPKDGLAMKRRIKELVPDANFPELSMIDTASAPLMEKLEAAEKANKTLADRLDSWEQKQNNSREEGELQSQLDGIRKQYGFTAEGMQKVIDRMKAKNNPDAESAAAWVASQERKAKPVTDSALLPSAMNLFGSNTADESWESLNRDPVKWADQELVKMINEFAEQDAA